MIFLPRLTTRTSAPRLQHKLLAHHMNTAQELAAGAQSRFAQAPRVNKKLYITLTLLSIAVSIWLSHTVSAWVQVWLATRGFHT